jgi:hypothetical protein
LKLRLNGTLQLVVYADDVSILGRSAHTINKTTEILMVASKEIALEVNADKTKYMVMSRDQNAGRSHNIKTDNSSFKRVEGLSYTYLGTTNQNYERNEVRECLLSCGAESFIFQFVIQKHKD